MTDIAEFYRIKATIKSDKEFKEMIEKSKGLYFKNPEKYI